MGFIEFIKDLLPALNIFVHLGIALAVVTALVFVLIGKKKKLLNFTRKYLENYFIPAAFMIAATAALGSLFYSEVAHYEPCKLCWFQRILMYPQSIILGIALLKKDRKIGLYLIPLSIIGLIISGYHYYIQRVPVEAFCSAEAVSCSTVINFDYGYISIPLMAFTAFFVIGCLLTFSLIFSKSKKESN
ncbi:MAG: disulfide oxidoreductase [archaeon]